MRPPLIVWHAGCPDGFGAAYWLSRHLDDAEFFPGVYGEQPPTGPDVDDRDVWLVDFSYPASVLVEIGRRARTLTVFDHHETALGFLHELAADPQRPISLFEGAGAMDAYCDVNELGGLEKTAAVLDITHSGVGLVALYIERWRGIEPPEFLLRIEDRDLWRTPRRYPDSDDIYATVTSRPYTVEAWQEMHLMDIRDLAVEGAAINRYRQQLIEQHLKLAYIDELFGHYVWVVPCPYAIASEVAGILAERTPDLFAAYYYLDVPNGFRQWGLRSASTGMNVAEVAQRMGGGGHRHAAGFREPMLPWQARGPQ